VAERKKTKNRLTTDHVKNREEMARVEEMPNRREAIRGAIIQGKVTQEVEVEEGAGGAELVGKKTKEGEDRSIWIVNKDMDKDKDRIKDKDKIKDKDRCLRRSKTS
jgi:hypothetical protein